MNYLEVAKERIGELARKMAEVESAFPLIAWAAAHNDNEDESEDAWHGQSDFTSN